MSSTFFSRLRPMPGHDAMERMRITHKNFTRKALHHFEKHGTKKELKTARNYAKRLGKMRARASLSLLDGISTELQVHPDWEARSVTILFEDLFTSDESTIVQQKKLITRSRRVLSAMSSHFHATIETQACANVCHISGGKVICPHVHAIILGPNIGDQAYAVAGAINSRHGPLTNGMLPVKVSEACVDQDSVRRTILYPFKLPDKCKTLYLNPKTGKKNQHESEKGDRYIRYERLLEILCAQPLRSLMFAGGTCKSIKTAALKASNEGRRCEVRKRLKKARGFWKRWRIKTGGERFQRVIVV